MQVKRSGLLTKGERHVVTSDSSRDFVDWGDPELAIQPGMGLLSERHRGSNSGCLYRPAAYGTTELLTELKECFAMKYILSFLLAAATTAIPALANDNDNDALERVQKSGEVLSDVMRAPDNGIPQDLLDKARCIGIVPGLKKAGFIVGAKYGRGTVVCREAAGGWSAPAMIRIEGGSIGLQIGAGETDVVFIVMNRDGMNKLLQDKFTIGASAEAMAGPVGRSASAMTDAQLHAEILSYSRSRGVFAGISLGGSTLRPDRDANSELYRRHMSQRDLLTANVKPPAGTNALYAELNRYAPASRYESTKR